MEVVAGQTVRAIGVDIEAVPGAGWSACCDLFLASRRAP